MSKAWTGSTKRMKDSSTSDCEGASKAVCCLFASNAPESVGDSNVIKPFQKAPCNDNTQDFLWMSPWGRSLSGMRGISCSPSKTGARWFTQKYSQLMSLIVSKKGDWFWWHGDHSTRQGSHGVDDIAELWSQWEPVSVAKRSTAGRCLYYVRGKPLLVNSPRQTELLEVIATTWLSFWFWTS